jgi:hypothetical protein
LTTLAEEGARAQGSPLKAEADENPPGSGFAAQNLAIMAPRLVSIQTGRHPDVSNENTSEGAQFPPDVMFKSRAVGHDGARPKTARFIR